jgi:beta-lactam-binding protein with PASTA domain
MTRAMLVCLAAVLTVFGLVACSSDGRSTPTSPVPPNIVMPDIVGMYWPNAEPKLRSLGWIGFLVKGPDMPATPGDRNRVLFQSPSPGERVNRDGAITVRFGS